MSIAEIAIKRPSLLIVFFTVLLLAGGISYSKLSYELMPDFSPPMLSISTRYPGAAPADVENTVSKKIEDIVAETDGVSDITTQSMEGVSQLNVTFLMGTDLDEKQQELQRKLNNLLATLPAEVETPSVSKISPSDQPIMQLTATSTLADATFYDLVKNRVLPQLQQVPGVGQITLIGGREREIQVNLNRQKLDYYGLSIPQVTAALARANADVPTGKVKNETTQIAVRLAGKFDSISELRELVVSARPDGSSVRIADIAEVADIVKDASSLNRLNGQNGLGLLIKKQNDANAVAISAEVKKRLIELEKRYSGKRLHFTVADDTADFTIDAANAVEHDLIIAVVLVSIVMLLFLHSLRDAGIVLVSIPVSLISTFSAMYFLGYTLNLMTLLAMSLVIGILVDDSIVVHENIHRHLKMGKDRRTAALDGRSEIGFSALAITMVDVVVFLPITLISTTIGDILRQYAVTIVISTLLSLVVSFTLTPWLTSRFGKVSHLDARKWLHWPLIQFERSVEWLITLYVRALDWGLHHKAVSFVIVLSLFGLTGFISSMGILGEELVAQGDQGKFELKLEYDKSTPLVANNQRTLAIEQFLRAQAEVQSVYANVAGGTTSGMTGAGVYGADNKTTLTVKLVPVDKRSVSTEKLMIRLRDQLVAQQSGLKISASVIGIGGGEPPIQLVLSADRQADVLSAGAHVSRLIAGLPGANNVSVSVEDGLPEVRVRLDREKLARLGLDVTTVGLTLQTALAGNTDTKFRQGLDEYDIRVQLDDFERKNPSDVAALSFINATGERINLSQFAIIEQSTGPSVLERKDRRTSVTVTSGNLGITSGKLANEVRAALAAHPLPENITVKWAGDIERQTESFGALGAALIAAIILIYLVMVALYDNFVYPFVVLFSIPVALIGALLALNLAKSSISVFTILGFLMLLGLVAKNAILLVDFTNERKAQGMSIHHALLAAARLRLRPILMTTLAMMIGMFPVAIAKGAGAEWKNGLATAMIGGLGSSLMLTVFVVPMLHYTVDALGVRLARWRHRRAFGASEIQYFTPNQPAA
jgi:hydrophobic/amphiphilic exporter-1 (mainly G- bacteria), HAE1 family